MQTKDEMCLAFLMYYPRVNLTKCASEDEKGFTNFYIKHFWYVLSLFTVFVCMLYVYEKEAGLLLRFFILTTTESSTRI